MMVFKRFQYENGLDIIAPLKHGTRWLEEETNPQRVILDPLAWKQLIDYPVTGNCYWIYREPKEHLLSALMTEIRGSIEFGEDETDFIIEKFLNKKGTHWSPITYQLMYEYWFKYKVKPLHLSKLSELFNSEIPFRKEKYEMRNYTKTKYDLSYIVEKVGKSNLDKLYKLSNEDSIFLKYILNNEYKLI